ncbi:hypothetical protein [Haloarchaeobius sp. HRN-SO-5]|uniref:hypothetical protein n=1 Tax=Haloarchaeobius sp. HRN-SO-5 TaxID=3446118 RepID=UPI003EBFEC06
MTDAQDALVAALTDWRRNLVALGLVVALVAVAAAVRSPMAYYGAGLASFVVWMAWFVLASVDWLHRADF